MKLILRGAIQRFKTVAIEALALFGRNTDQEIEKLRSLRIHCARLAFQRRHQDGGQLLKGAELIRGEEARLRGSHQVDLCDRKLRDFLGLPRVLASGGVGLGARALLLGLGGQRRHGGRSQQILDKLPAFHNFEILN
jgi:hypothetical protein